MIRILNTIAQYVAMMIIYKPFLDLIQKSEKVFYIIIIATYWTIVWSILIITFGTPTTALETQLSQFITTFRWTMCRKVKWMIVESHGKTKR